MKNSITLRKWCDSDIESLAKYANNYNIARYLTDAFPHPYTVEDANAYISIVKAEKTTNAILHRYYEEVRRSNLHFIKRLLHYRSQ